MQVEALRKGYYANARIKEGRVFDIKDESELGKWMLPIGWEPKSEKGKKQKALREKAAKKAEDKKKKSLEEKNPAAAARKAEAKGKGGKSAKAKSKNKVEQAEVI